MSIDTSNVTVTEQYEDPDTGEQVTIIDGIETSRTPPTPERANERELLSRAVTALTGNADFLANAAPTNADVVAQVRALTRQVNALIRLVGHQLDTVDGT